MRHYGNEGQARLYTSYYKSYIELKLIENEQSYIHKLKILFNLLVDAFLPFFTVGINTFWLIRIVVPLSSHHMIFRFEVGVLSENHEVL